MAFMHSTTAVESGGLAEKALAKRNLSVRDNDAAVSDAA